MFRPTAPDCPHCKGGTVLVDEPWLDGVCTDCGRSVDPTAIDASN